MTRIAAILAAAIVIAGAGGGVWWYLARGADGFSECRDSVIATGGDIGGPFTLTDQTGQRVTEADVIDRPALVYFGYTMCPDICPVDVARNGEATEILAERGIDVKPVFITIDPARDNVEALADYASYMPGDLEALTGTDAEIAKAAKEYKVYYAKAPGADADTYLMDHSTFTYLMAPGVGFLDLIRRDKSAEQVADKVECYVNRLPG